MDEEHEILNETVSVVHRKALTIQARQFPYDVTSNARVIGYGYGDPVLRSGGTLANTSSQAQIVRLLPHHASIMPTLTDAEMVPTNVVSSFQPPPTSRLIAPLVLLMV